MPFVNSHVSRPQFLFGLSVSFLCGSIVGILGSPFLAHILRFKSFILGPNAIEDGNNLSSTHPHATQRDEVPDNANDECPGIHSENAGTASACAGCPNQNICASKEAKDTADTSEMSEVQNKLAGIKKKILVLSGKGGVGKSTVSSQLGWILQKREFLVGLLDVDVCGPSIPTMTGSRDRDVHASADGWSPIYIRENFAIMSIGFLLPQEDDAVIWRGPKKNGLIRQFLTDVSWNELDVLIIDTPPGTSDEHLSVVTYLNPASVDGAIVVTTPQQVALRDVRKEINFCKKVGVSILGVVENMTDSLFADACPGAVKMMCEEMEVPYAGTIPMDRDLLMACETGASIMDVNPESAASNHLNSIVDTLLDSLGLPHRKALAGPDPTTEDSGTSEDTGIWSSV